MLTLNKKWSFPLRISSVNVTKSAGNGQDLVTFTEEIRNGKLYFLCSVKFTENTILTLLNISGWLWASMTKLSSWLHYLLRMTGQILQNWKIWEWKVDTVTMSPLGPFPKSYENLGIRWIQLVEITWFLQGRLKFWEY